MTRPRRSSAASEESNIAARDQELGSMYDYLAKIILLGPSGTGKSCLLHRFVKNEWRVLSSQTIGVEFATKIIKVGTGARRKRIKLQLWDTAGTERFRSVSRSYYRGAAGAILIYDITSHSSFNNLQPFLNDARALASPNLTLVLAGNKLDLADSNHLVDTSMPPPTPSSYGSTSTITLAGGDGGQAGGYSMGSVSSTTSRSTITANYGGGGGGTHQQRATIAPDGREVTAGEASRWASSVNVPVTMEVSAFSGDGVDEVFARLARMILTKIELGEIDPDDPMSGIQYGDAGGLWHSNASDGASIKSALTTDEIGASRRTGRARGKSRGQWGVGVGMREWEDVFTLSARRNRRGCC
ncbi:ras-domain-containing protein [Cryphonectria parasitica EP155]|uniref:Ras-domain-containing protein n=1 Tax=Cryphonectria parasitica (strain ATCC 38755 / EP155) TaxID=660469 RepID=A0A9P5CNT0_CRYP1|nr:ras-domain-containing protein [Cryphonectria parasitica EP155]KAF3764255.1 ras-domain-containing protein [Cryphonectria parasitica EP155]